MKHRPIEFNEFHHLNEFTIQPHDINGCSSSNHVLVPGCEYTMRYTLTSIAKRSVATNVSPFELVHTALRSLKSISQTIKPKAKGEFQEIRLEHIH